MILLESIGPDNGCDRVTIKDGAYARVNTNVTDMFEGRWCIARNDGDENMFNYEVQFQFVVDPLLGGRDTWYLSFNILFGGVNESGEGNNWGSFNDVLTNTDYYIPTDKDVGQDDIAQKASVILTVITNIGIILSVLMSAIIGLKYMLGSVEEKADYKKDMVPYLVGTCLLFGICTIVKILQAVGESINVA